MHSQLAALRSERVLVTGATGFIGRYFGEFLVQHQIETYGLSRTAAAQTLPRNVVPVPIDIQEPAEVMGAFEQIRPDRVVHLAAAGVTEPFLPIEQAVEVNIRGTVNLLEASERIGVRRFVHVGTAYERPAAETVRGPGNPYVASKLGAWSFWHAFAQEHKLNSIALRLFHVYGPRQSARGLVSAAIRAALSGETLRMTQGEQLRDFVYVTDIVQALIAALATLEFSTQTYDIGSGTGRSVRSVVAQIFEQIDGDGHYELGALSYRPNEEMVLIAQPATTRHDLGWTTTVDFEVGLAATIQACRSGDSQYEF
ncbi:MAG: NAD-dependent epimerase/dehydratase family protein [Anaerolineae bacterium]